MSSSNIESVTLGFPAERVSSLPRVHRGTAIHFKAIDNIGRLTGTFRVLFTRKIKRAGGGITWYLRLERLPDPDPAKLARPIGPYDERL